MSIVKLIKMFNHIGSSVLVDLPKYELRYPNNPVTAAGFSLIFI